MSRLASGIEKSHRRAVAAICRSPISSDVKMNAAQISKPGGDWEFVERDVPERALVFARFVIANPGKRGTIKL